MASHLPLSAILLSKSPSAFKSATRSPFLELAGTGRLRKSVLSRWLTQDRLYAQAYVRFASLLLANVALPRSISARNGGERNIHERLADCVLGALVNVRRELGFFEDTAALYNLELDAFEGSAKDDRFSGMTDATESYLKLFERIGVAIQSQEVGFLSGLVVLWGTEKCYLEAWRWAKSFSAKNSLSQEEMTADLDGGALREKFIPNWTADEFVNFVNEVEMLMNELWSLQSDCSIEEKFIATTQQEAEQIWDELLLVEKDFWPSVNE